MLLNQDLRNMEIDSLVKLLESSSEDKDGFVKVNRLELIKLLKESSSKIDSLTVHIKRLNIGYDNLRLLANHMNEEITSTLNNDESVCRYGNCT